VIVLDWFELEQAATVGVKRACEALRDGRRNKAGQVGVSLLDHVNGAIGEYVAAKALNITWTGSVNTFTSEPDLAPCFEVRTRSLHWHDLIIRPSDEDGRVFLLVTGTMDTGYMAHGGIKARDGKRVEWLKTHGNRPGAYFVPQSELIPMGDVVRWFRSKVLPILDSEAD